MIALTAVLLAAAAQIGAGAPQPITGIENAFPAWSPDGSKIVFQSNRTGEWHLYLMNPDGTGVRDLTPTLRDCRNPSFSPDGSRIAFTRRRGKTMDIWVMPVAG
jgi:Tol biopolymer transport system component